MKCIFFILCLSLIPTNALGRFGLECEEADRQESIGGGLRGAGTTVALEESSILDLEFFASWSADSVIGSIEIEGSGTYRCFLVGDFGREDDPLVFGSIYCLWYVPDGVRILEVEPAIDGLSELTYDDLGEGIYSINFEYFECGAADTIQSVLAVTLDIDTTVLGPANQIFTGPVNDIFENYPRIVTLDEACTSGLDDYYPVHPAWISTAVVSSPATSWGSTKALFR